MKFVVAIDQGTTSTRRFYLIARRLFGSGSTSMSRFSPSPGGLSTIRAKSGCARSR